VSDSINAGLNLEMPGPARWRNPELVNHLLGAHKIDKKTIDKHATEILTWVQKLVKLNPDLVYAKPGPERTRDDKEKDAAIVRSLGTEGIVLLKNEGDVLPINDKRKVAVIGPNAKDRVLSGGGSALLASAWSQTPWEGLQANKPKDVELSYALGAYTAKFLPIFDLELFSAPSNGKPGFDLMHYPIVDGKQAAQPAVQEVWHKSDMFLGDFFHPELGTQFWSEIKSNFVSPVDGEYEFGLAVTGHARLWVDDELVLDTRGQKKGSAFFNCGTQEKRGTCKVQKGKVGHPEYTPAG
jgi:beta-glucosidase